ncbi:NitT/TauT family transport system ATP-binding protein [Antricoccus suffuscus]|uniref:NitT/TauT family transport system ATP-binding protein n=1 Tax=Antricoccus suffuscus TaxID=1629062 RepID=A0A2T1A5T4_9ACTN|nr:ABC transporter ATP-binding protein [Antricoccus suffuscus]PRZ43975.1 NitT/TauT family transport system ATP-binding protein [Antricoccus suffuscus]
MPAIKVTKASHWFPTPKSGVVHALQDIDLTVEKGEFLAIVGPSGCGKTTLLNAMAGLDKPLEGDVSVLGHQPRAGDPEVGYVLAKDSLLPWRTALGNAALGLEIQGVSVHERETRATEALGVMGLGDFTGAYGAQLSHGMRQRVALARSFATKPEILLMDEPFSALDAQTRIQVHDAFLEAWERRRMTVVLITHDLTEAVGLADRVVIMTRRPGRIKSIHEIDLPRPRSMLDLQGNDRFHQIFETIWSDLREEVIEDSAFVKVAAS